MYTGQLPAASNRADWISDLYVYDDTTGDAYDLTGATIVFEVREKDGGSAVLSATTSNGKVTLPQTGVFRVSFTSDEMSDVDPNDYAVGITILLSSVTTQFLAGTVTIIDGIVS